MSIPKFLVKVVVFILLLFIIHTVLIILHPIVMTDVSIQAQLSNSDTNLFLYNLYTTVSAWSWLIPVVLGVVVFWKEFMLVYNLLTNKGDK